MKKIITTVLCAATTMFNTLNSQEIMKENNVSTCCDMSHFKSHNSNPWGSVYADAITENKEGEVSIQPITYELNGLKISANVETPAGYDKDKKISGTCSGTS